MSTLSRLGFLRVLPLLAAILVVSFGAYVVGRNAMSGVLQAFVESNAQKWGGILMAETPALDDVLLGTKSPTVVAGYFRTAPETDDFFRYRIYDVLGYLRYDSAIPETAAFIQSGEADKSVAQLIGASSGTFEAAPSADDPHGFFARTFWPLEKDGRSVGVFEGFSDETQTWGMLEQHFQLVAIQFAGLLLCSFLVPGLLYLRRSGQLEFLSLRLKHTEQYDELTGTLNRATFSSVVAEQIQSANARDQAVAVHFLDIDNFKDINEGRGHIVGDQVLRQIGARLHRLLGTRERLARLGGDEFAICQPYDPSSPDVVEALAQAVVREMARPFRVDNLDIRIGVSLGYARFPRDGRSVPALIRAADIAGHKAKETSRGGAVEYVPSIAEERRQRQDIERILRDALVHQGFEVNYQPFYSVDGKALRGFEALLRLKGADGEPISPELFIPIAEHTGLIGEIGAWVLNAAADTALEWPDDISVAVNLSPAQFQSHNMPHLVAQVLRRTGLPARRLELEVTESLLIEDTEKVLADLHAIKDLGVSIALDDFGTGYSSLAYLWRFPFDKLKVDKSFMTDLAKRKSKSREVLSTIIALGRVLGLKITAEGVETGEQAKVLRELDCDLIQGFLYGRPLHVDDLSQVLAQKVKSDLGCNRPAPGPCAASGRRSAAS